MGDFLLFLYVSALSRFGIVAFLHVDTDLQLDLNIMLIFIPVPVSDFEAQFSGSAVL